MLRSDLQLAFMWTDKIQTIKLIKHMEFLAINHLIELENSFAQMDHKMCSPTAVVRRK